MDVDLKSREAAVIEETSELEEEGLVIWLQRFVIVPASTEAISIAEAIAVRV